MLKWPKLIQGTLIKRYQRFKADVKLRNGHVVTAHCTNTGRMISCSEPGRTVYLSKHNRPERKLKYTWEMIEMENSLVGINTMVPNKLVKSAVEAGKVPALTGYDNVRAEVKYGKNSRVDLLLEKDENKCYVEIKNCTLVENNTAFFPDAKTTRGLKHLMELMEEVKKGNRAVMFYLVQRMDARYFRPAAYIDPDYAEALKKTVKKGVEILIYDVYIDIEGIMLRNKLKYEL